MKATECAQGLRVSIVVPCYQSAEFLAETVQELCRTLRDSGLTFECILVDDASDDSTWFVIETLSSTFPETRGIRLRKNSGQHVALVAGCLEVRSPVIVTMDDDGQNPPSEITALLSALDDQKKDVIFGNPSQKNQGRWRRTLAALYRSSLSKVSGLSHVKDQSNFRAFRSDLVTQRWANNQLPVSLDGLLYSSTDLFGVINVAHRPRARGQSRYSAWRLLRHGINVGISTTTRLLHVGSIVGLAFSLLAVFGAVALVVWALLSPGREPGFAGIALLILFTSGINLLVLGISGFYLANVFRALSPLPMFTLRASEQTKDGRSD